MENYYRLREKTEPDRLEEAISKSCKAETDGSKKSDIFKFNFNGTPISNVYKTPVQTIKHDNILSPGDKRSSFETMKLDDKCSVNSCKTMRFSHLTNNSISYILILGDKSIFKNYYAPKVICLVSLYPFFWEHSKILKSIYKFTTNRSGKIKKPIEKIIENLVFEVPVPPRGVYQVFI